MNRKGLGRYGVAAKTVLRERATDADNLLICPECGTPVGNSKGSHEVAQPDLVDLDADPAVLVTHGWRCDRHSGYEVVIPVPVGSSDASTVVHTGWVGVRVRMADGFVRTIPTPEKELADIESVDEPSTTNRRVADGGEEVGRQ